MYAFIDGVMFLAGLAGFVATIVKGVPHYCPLGLAWIAIYPIVNQLVYNTCGSLFGRRVLYKVSKKCRIVYDPSYNISFCGVEKLHPFDSHKYGNVFDRLVQMGIISEQSVVKPGKVPRKLLLEKLSKLYLLKMNYTLAICSYVEMPLFIIPAFLLRWRVLNPMLLATEGTILASVMALEQKWAVNLSGGYHHASCTGGGGFCVYPDISLAVHYLQTRCGVRRVMIVDLDAHQGNGHERDHIGREDVFIVDAYNHGIYPNDRTAKQAISLDIPVWHSTNDEQYLKMLHRIQESVHAFNPDFVIYNAGTDCLVGDPLGSLSISEQGIIQRDETVFRMCLDNNVPVVMVLSGGYQKTNAKVIAESINNLYAKFDGIK